MKRLIIICEGETEQEFCNSLLRNELQREDFFLSAPLIKKTMGGIVAWKYLKQQILNSLREGAYVTTLIDFYGIKDHHNFPNWDQAKAITDKSHRVANIEEGMADDVMNPRFIPYIQLHEFEALLFCDMDSFNRAIPAEDFIDKNLLADTLDSFPNPELINDNPATSPSHRMMHAIAGYNKVVYGNIIAEKIGLTRISEHCPRFGEWIDKLRRI